MAACDCRTCKPSASDPGMNPFDIQTAFTAAQSGSVFRPTASSPGGHHRGTEKKDYRNEEEFHLLIRREFIKTYIHVGPLCCRLISSDRQKAELKRFKTKMLG